MRVETRMFRRTGTEDVMFNYAYFTPTLSKITEPRPRLTGPRITVLPPLVEYEEL